MSEGCSTRFATSSRARRNCDSSESPYAAAILALADDGEVRWAYSNTNFKALALLAERVPYGFGLSTRELLGHRMVWHGGNADGHSALVAYAPDDDLGIVLLTHRGFVWLTELLPPWIGEPVPAQTAAQSAPLLGGFKGRPAHRFDSHGIEPPTG